MAQNRRITSTSRIDLLTNKERLDTMIHGMSRRIIKGFGSLSCVERIVQRSIPPPNYVEFSLSIRFKVTGFSYMFTYFSHGKKFCLGQKIATTSETSLTNSPKYANFVSMREMLT